MKCHPLLPLYQNVICFAGLLDSLLLSSVFLLITLVLGIIWLISRFHQLFFFLTVDVILLCSFFITGPCSFFKFILKNDYTNFGPFTRVIYLSQELGRVTHLLHRFFKKNLYTIASKILDQTGSHCKFQLVLTLLSNDSSSSRNGPHESALTMTYLLHSRKCLVFFFIYLKFSFKMYFTSLFYPIRSRIKEISEIKENITMNNISDPLHWFF